MAKAQSLDEVIGRKAAEFAEQVRHAAAIADKEEEIRIEVERQLAFLEKETGVRLEGKHEFTIAQGRVDSFYRRVLIEYKNPSSPSDRLGPRLDSPGSKKVVEQIKTRFRGLKDKQGHPLNSLFGVGCDGKYFIFVRFRDNKWDVREPVEVNKVSAERFLWALYNLGEAGKPFQPEYLAGDFGAKEGSIATEGIHALYDAIATTDHPKAQTFFKQWKILFGEVCGYDVDNPSDKIKKLAEFYQLPAKGLKPAELLFALHTYYALFMKLLASEIVAFFHKLPTPLKGMLSAVTSAKLKREMEELEAGSIFRHLNITNFLEGDLFAWYTAVWTEPIEHLVRRMVAKLDDYNPGTMSEDPATSRDLLKKLYQQLFPKSVRHDLGEYYTPDWLAEHVLNELGYTGDPDKRLLDPACGSGTFLVMAINRIKSWFEENRERCSFDEGDLCKKILANVVGFDLNPLAVMAARTNYLISIRDIVGHADKVEIPIYLCDSIMTPSEYGLFTGTELGEVKHLKTAAATFFIPTEIAKNRDIVARYAETLEFCVRNSFSGQEFLVRCRDEGLSITSDSLHEELYDELVALDKANKNGVWARIIKNAFAPLFTGTVDFVVGNPPWVNWESLPADYRDATKPIWEKYGLFTLKGHAARLGGGKKDLSMLFVYVCLDNYLSDSGTLGFVITQTLFKTREAGNGFRRFQFKNRQGQKIHIKPIRVIDMTDLHPFEDATNRTASFLCKRSQSPITWPIEYQVWTPNGIPRFQEGVLYSTVRKNTTKTRMGAVPMVSNVKNSAWLTAPANTLSGLEKVMGKSEVKAHAGICTWMNSVFWLQEVEEAAKGKVRIVNWYDVGKIKVDRIQTVIEADLVYPLLRGRDVHRWTANPSTHILLTQDPATRIGISESIMKKKYALTFQYLKQFEAKLRGRSGYKKYFDKNDPFWTVYNVGEYTIAPHRVVFKELSDFFQCAVLPYDQKPVVPDTKLRFITCGSAEEAHFFCGLLNSSPAVLYLYSSATWVQTADYQASDIARLSIPRFDSSSKVHRSISDLSERCHDAARRGASQQVMEGEVAIDKLAAKLWKLDPGELEFIKKAIRDLAAKSPSAAFGQEEEGD